MQQLKLTHNSGIILDCWNDGEMEYGIVFTQSVSLFPSFHYSITPILQDGVILSSELRNLDQQEDVFFGSSIPSFTFVILSIIRIARIPLII